MIDWARKLLQTLSDMPSAQSYTLLCTMASLAVRKLRWAAVDAIIEPIIAPEAAGAHQEQDGEQDGEQRIAQPQVHKLNILVSWMINQAAGFLDGFDACLEEAIDWIAAHLRRTMLHTHSFETLLSRFGSFAFAVLVALLLPLLAWRLAKACGRFSRHYGRYDVWRIEPFGASPGVVRLLVQPKKIADASLDKNVGRVRRVISMGFPCRSERASCAASKFAKELLQQHSVYTASLVVVHTQ